ncbi:MAG: hypothetical protein KDB27_29470 [Planctomycetales bacterium]|nr:hypothetical protein [Planctomycetales bacterium]
MPNRLPIIVLAGSDSRPGAAPDGMDPDEMLAGPKGTIPLQNGRCMAAELVHRIRASECFSEPLLLGPKQWYADKVDCEITHVEGSLIDTLRLLARIISERFAGDDPVAITACDILPSVADFQRLLENDYAPHAESVFWWQMVESQPEDMGASSWKPTYHMPLQQGDSPRTLYPGHVVIVRPSALRFQLINRLLELAYKYRNRPLNKRHIGITLGAIRALITQDLMNLREFQLPVLTFVLPYVGLRDFFKYRNGTATLRDHEYFLAKTFLHRRFHHVANNRPFVIAATTLRSFAKDIDTKAELEEVESTLCVSE